MTKARNIADLGSNDVLETSSTGLDVTGTLVADSLTVDGVARVDGDITIGRTTGSYVFTEIDGGSERAGIHSSSLNDLVFKVNNQIPAIKIDGGTRDVSFYEDTGTTAKMVWDASAESLEIGGIEGSASFPLSVKSGTNDHAIAIEEASGLESWQFGVDSDGDLGFYNSGSTTASVTFDDSGNVGIGTSAPSAILHVEDSTPVLRIKSTADTEDGLIHFADTSSNFAGVIAYSHNGNDMKFFTNGTERARIDSSGNLLVGTTSIAALSGLAGVSVSAPTAGVAITSTSGVGQSWMNYVTTSAGDLAWYDATGAIGMRMYLSGSGSLYNSTGTYGTISDIKLKQDISDANSQWDDIKAVKFKNYKLKADVAKYGDDAVTMLGVVAQDLESSGMGGLIDETYLSETDEDGNVVEAAEKTKTVKYSILYMKAVKALQEAMERIEQLEQRVDALENN